MRKISIIAIAVVAVSLAAAYYFFAPPYRVRFEEGGKISVNKEKQYWAKRMDEVGPREAYREFGVAVEGLPAGLQHAAAHIFGETLFENVPLRDAVKICDEKYVMGCFHALFGSAAQFMGTEAFLGEMKYACAQRNQAMERLCLHGVGHGILGSLGYETDDLVDALELCKKIPDAGNLTTGCWGGAFMEYNVQTLISLESPERPLNDENLYEPCPRLTDEYRASCMFWQTTWWNVALLRSMDDDHIFREMGAMCAGHPDRTLAEACLKGVGFRAAWNQGYSASRAAELCGSMQTFADRGICWRSAKLDLPKRAASESEHLVCADQDGAGRDECEKAL